MRKNEKFEEMHAVNELRDELVCEGLFTEDELQLLISINGFSMETLNSAIVGRYAFKDLNQLLENEKRKVKEYFNRIIKK